MSLFTFPTSAAQIVVAATLALVCGCSTVQSNPQLTKETPIAATSVSATAPSTSLEIAFITHLEANLPEQDIYIERVPGSGEVFRVTVGENNMNAPLFSTAVAVKHDPFDPAMIGPHPKGKALGMTLGEWLRHRGTGTYQETAGEGTLDLEFTGLVPNGVYTMWHAFIALPPTTPFSGVLDLPLGARDGSESRFVADENGNARFAHTFRPGLQMSDVWTTSMLAIAYHSDGETYGGVPGDFGRVTHVPIFTFLPKREGIE